jgi:hypothetical protein
MADEHDFDKGKQARASTRARGRSERARSSAVGRTTPTQRARKAAQVRWRKRTLIPGVTHEPDYRAAGRKGGLVSGGIIQAQLKAWFRWWHSAPSIAAEEMPDPVTMPALRAVVATYAEIEDGHIAAGKNPWGRRWEAFHWAVFGDYILSHSHKKDPAPVPGTLKALYTAIMETPDGAALDALCEPFEAAEELRAHGEELLGSGAMNAIGFAAKVRREDAQKKLSDVLAKEAKEWATWVEDA